MNTGPAAAPRWALLAGNFAIGCGVMSTAGVLNDIARSLEVSVALSGQLIGAASVVMALGSPLLARLLSGRGRCRLLVLVLLWFAVGHLLSALATSYAALTPPAQRGQAITFIFLGWSAASVLGMPLAAYIGETWGWATAFVGIALLALPAAAGIWRALPDGLRPPALSLADWRTVFTRPVLMAIVAVMALSSAGQFMLFSYFAPYCDDVLDASAAQVSLLFLWSGAVGLAGNVLLTRAVDRVGAAHTAAPTLGCMALSLLAWPLATALISLNSSAMYAGQFAGPASGGTMIAASGYGGLSWVALAWMCAAIATSLWAARRMRGAPHA